MTDTGFQSFPDIEALVRKVIEDATIQTHTSLPKSPTYPLVLIRRVGGIPANRRMLDRANIQIEGWADGGTGGGSAAFDACEDARRAVSEMEDATFKASDGWPIDFSCTGTEPSLGMAFLPDQATGKDRYICGIYVIGRSIPA